MLINCSRQVKTIVVHSMHERKVEMAKRVGGFFGLPGGFGTFEEVSFLFPYLSARPINIAFQLLEVISWSQIGLHNKRKWVLILE